MKAKTLSILAGAAAFAVTGAAMAGDTILEADYVGANEGNDIYRLYANVGEGNAVGFWGGEPGVHTFDINNITLEGGVGSGFHQDPSFLGALPVNSDAFPAFPQAEFSTYFTIGVEPGYDAQNDVGEVFQLTPGFSPTIAGQTTITGEGGVVSQPDGPNAIAGEDGRVLLAQFAVAAGEHVDGTIGLSITTLGLGDTGNLDVIEYFTTVPAPGALALLGVAGLVGSRRRRA